MSKHTPLRKAMMEGKKPTRPTPLDALNLAQEQWLEHQRININTLAEALGINRVTLFRWVGNRDIFHAEVIWSFVEPIYEDIRCQATGTGITYICNVFDSIFSRFSASGRLRAFIQMDPEYAMRILTSKESPIQERTISVVNSMLEEQVASGELEPPIPVDTLAYLLVRLVESFLYGDVVSGRQPDWQAAMTAIRLLTTGKP